MYNNNQQPESVFDFEMQDFDAVPQGQYIATFKDVQKTKHDEYGDGLMFIFEVAHGEHKGQNATRITKPHVTPNNATGKMISGITGRVYQRGDKINLRPFAGKPYNILMEQTKGGKTRIAQVWPYQPQQTMPVQTAPQHQPLDQVQPNQFPSNDPTLDQIPF